MTAKEQGLPELLAAIEAMQEYRPALQKNKAARKGYVPYMAKKAAACEGEEYGWVHMGRVLMKVRDTMQALAAIASDTGGRGVAAQEAVIVSLVNVRSWMVEVIGCDPSGINVRSVDMGIAALRAQPAGGGGLAALMDKFRALVAAHDGEFAFVDGVKLCLRELESLFSGCQPDGRELPKHFVECSESEKSAYMRGIAVGENIASRDPVFAALDSVVPGWRERGSDTESAAATAITELSARATSNGARPFRWDDEEGEAPSAWGSK